MTWLQKLGAWDAALQLKLGWFNRLPTEYNEPPAAVLAIPLMVLWWVPMHFVLQGHAAWRAAVILGALTFEVGSTWYEKDVDTNGYDPEDVLWRSRGVILLLCAALVWL